MSDFRKRNQLAEALSRGQKTRRVGWTKGVLSVLCILGGVGFGELGFAQDSAIPVAGSAWTSPSGRAIVDLNAKKAAKTKKARPIRQTQALTAAQEEDDQLLAPPAYDDSLVPPPSDDGELIDPTTLERAPANPALGPLDETTDFVPSEPQPSAIDVGPAPIEPAPTPVETVPPPVEPAPTADANVAPTLTTDSSQPQPLEPLGSNGAAAGRSGNAANRNAYYGAISGAPNVSSNPYANVGQAEYNPRQFNACGGNFTTNGYRSTPPAAAYGQNLWGSPCVEQGDGCGYCCGGLFQNTSLSAGVLAMRSPLDLEDTGNFGGDFALNWGSAQPLLFGLNVQSGARVTQTDFNGTSANGYATDDARTQLFWTAGLYFRAPAYSNGWSAGIAYDYLKEDYYRKYELGQMRAELSRSFAGFCEIGFRGAFALNEEEINFFNSQGLTVTAKAQAVSYYTMFLSKKFENGAEASIFGGATEWSEGIVGANFEAPLSASFAIKGGATYVIPTERGLNDNRLEENWNVSCGLVWRLGGNAQDATDSQRPLFDVADNGTFLQNFLR